MIMSEKRESSSRDFQKARTVCHTNLFFLAFLRRLSTVKRVTKFLSVFYLSILRRHFGHFQHSSLPLSHACAVLLPIFNSDIHPGGEGLMLETAF